MTKDEIKKRHDYITREKNQIKKQIETTNDYLSKIEKEIIALEAVLVDNPDSP